MSESKTWCATAGKHIGPWVTERRRQRYATGTYIDVRVCKECGEPDSDSKMRLGITDATH